MENNTSDFNQSTPPEQQSPTENWDIAMAAARKEQEKKNRLEKAIAEAEQNGKEIFNYNKFVDSYWRKNAFSAQLQGNESEAMIQHYKEEYYLEFPDIKTIEEFAAELEKRDESLGG